jgi:hypothetical protein
MRSTRARACGIFAQYSEYSSHDKDILFDTFDRFIAVLVIRYFRRRGRSTTSIRRSDQRQWSRMQIGTFNWKVNPTMGHDYSRRPGRRYSFVRSQLFQIPHCPEIRINRVLRSRLFKKTFSRLNHAGVITGSAYFNRISNVHYVSEWIELICSARVEKSD